MNRLQYLLLIGLVAMLAGCTGPVVTEDPHPYAIDTDGTLDLTRAPDDLWERLRRGFAIPNINTERSRKWTDYYASHPESVLVMTRRASKYLYHVVDELNRRGMPTELALLPFVESAYDPSALSRSSAMGLWQFIPSTARHFNLQHDWWKDERRDLIASTTAALDYLEYLYEFQGDWHLALASYNMGEGAIQRAMKKNEQQDLPTDYLSLDLPKETRNYVPRLQAFKNLIAEPVRYGLTLPAIRNTPYFTHIHRKHDMDVAVVAHLAEMPEDDFLALNAGLNQSVLLADKGTTFLLPHENVETFNKNLRQYRGRLTTWRRHKRQPGETDADIARQYGISLSELQKVNENQPALQKEDADTVLVPGSADSNSPQLVSLNTESPAVLTNRTAARSATPASTPAGQPAYASETADTVHTIRPGDTLYGLARRYRTTVKKLRQHNQLRGDHLRPGKQLRIPDQPAGQQQTASLKRT